ncbi:MAG TPA: CHAT domain-containing protein [Candidatus Saccharimonadales bacterium]|jgi:CHAT domain-containing protein/tetratricopeptide (TPR) repeat protein|nr:CHAT domain-containing protein [Candidatus Saccharimonadales bacterium]
MVHLRRFPVLLTLAFLVTVCSWSLIQQPAKRLKDYVPPELQASDPQVQAFFDASDKSEENGNYPEAFQHLQKALDLCVKKGFLGDRALVEARMSVVYFLQGKIEDTKRLRLSSLTDSLKTGNLVLQADTLVALFTMAQVSGNMNEALDLATKALDVARKSKNFWIQSRALGELGRLQLVMGRPEEARASIEEALRIDRLNHYDWEANHLLYLAWITARDVSKFDQAIQLMTSARELAIKRENYLDFMQASTSLGRAYVQKGKVNDGIAIFEHSRDGVSDGRSLFSHPASFKAAMSLPYFRVAFLEAAAMAYQASQRPDDAIKSWSELYEIATASGFNLAAAEAAHGMADLYQTKKDFAKAVSYYALAAEGWAVNGNTQRRMDALGGQAYSLFQQGEGDKALRIEEELVPLAKSSGDSRRQFLGDLFIAEILQPRGETERTEKALKDAESLLSSDLALQDLQPNAVFELFNRLASVNETKHEDFQQLIYLEKAMTPAEALGAEMRREIAKRVKAKLSALNVRELAERAYSAGNLGTALLYFELIQHFEQTDARWSGKSDEYNRNAGNRPLKIIWEIPHRLIDQPHGADTLEANLQQMGPIAERVKFPILVVLAYYYTRETRPDKVVQFATAGFGYLRLADKDQPQDFDVDLICELAYAHLLQNDAKAATRQVIPCLNSAKKLGDQRRLAMAHQINIWVLQAAGRQDDAQESIHFLAQQAPDDPLHYVELARLKGQQGGQAEAVEAWRRALSLYEARKDLRGMASTHLSLAYSLRLSQAAQGDEDLSHLQAALSLYQQLSDPQGQARVSIFMGQYFAGKKERNRALGYFEEGLKLARQSKNADLEAFAFSEIGNAYRNAGETAKALESYRKAGDLYHGVQDAANESSQIQNQAGALDALHKTEEALETYLKAEHLADSSGAWLPRYWARRSLAGLYDARGDFEAALTSLRDARVIANSANQPLNSAWASLALAQDLSLVGDREAAVDAVNLALPVFRQSNDHENEGTAYLELMAIYGARESEFKDFDKALGYYQSARQLAEKYDPSRIASINLDAVEIYWQQKRFKEAASLANEALGYYQRTKNEWGQANALLSLAEVQRSAGDVLAATASMKRAEPLIKRADDYYMTGRFYYGLANQRKKEGRFKEAIEDYERVIQLLEKVKSASDQTTRRKVSENYGFIYDELIDTLYLLAVRDAQAKLPAADQALQKTELNKSRAFTTSWGRTFVGALQRQLPVSLQEKERTLAARQGALQAELEQALSGQDIRPVKQVQEDLKRLANELTGLQKELRQASPAYAEARYPRAVAIADLPLLTGETLVEFKMLEDSLLVWIVIGGSGGGPGGGPQLAAFYKVDHPRQWFEERILGLRSAFNRGFPDQFDPVVSEELFNAFFPAPCAERLMAAKSVIFVPDDILFLLPFEMLSPRASKSEFVLLKTPTSYFPSAAALRLARTVTPSKREWPAQFFALADPITTPDDERFGTASILSEVASLVVQGPAALPSMQPAVIAPSGDASTQPTRGGPVSVEKLKARGYFFERLPETANEANHIAALFPEGPAATLVRTGTDATKRELLQTDLGRFRFVHFATHGFLPVEPGVREPALVLSYDGKAEERMMLTLSEVVQLKLHAEMVVLSACNTGSGRVTRAEGVASLGTSFLAAGASSVTVSLWQVADESTAILMQEYYHNLLNGLPKNAALAAARAALVAQGHTNPFFWAPFVLTGE